MKQVFVMFFVLITTLSTAQLSSPDDFFPHQRGEHFTPHHQLVDYFEYVSNNSPLVKLVEYGTTNQGRPMIVAIVASEANQLRLDAIRKNNLRIAGIELGTVDSELSQAIVWLSFSVHGNEAAGSESAPQVLYDLIDPNNSENQSWLENTIIIIDPAVNPDGYSRYTHWVRNVTGDEFNLDHQDIEHNEPWPGGRVNHYLFDLNRDWAWQTQVESQQRMVLYNQWLPHVHADLHEMGKESPYYFAPAAKPYHKYLTKWQRDFQTTIGKNHAKYFDQEGWLYFTKEVFDLFYPSYGDTYPMFSGAIGMTYEQGGSHRGGREVELENGETLSLKDRIEHHLTTALSTVEITSQHKDEVLDQFASFYRMSSSNPPGKYKSYLIKKDIGGERLKFLAQLLDRQGISYGTVSSSQNLSGFNYTDPKSTSMSVQPGDMLVSTQQPKGLFAQILLDPSSELEDSVTYDITAWSLPYAYGLDALASTKNIQPDTELTFVDAANNTLADAYAYVIPWHNLSSTVAASQVLQKEYQIRTTPVAITFDGATFPAGSIIITKGDNQKRGDNWFEDLNTIATELNTTIVPISTGFAEDGPDIGSGQLELFTKPKVLCIMGENVSSNAYGQLKWYFDRVIDYPLSSVTLDNISGIEMSNYNTLVLPHGNYSLSNSTLEGIGDWVSNGGKLIAMDGATRALADEEGFGLKQYATDDEKSDSEKSNEQADLAARYNHYSDRERNYISNYVPGAIFELEVDNSHPLGYGIGDTYYSLRTSSTNYPLMVDAANVIYHPDKDGQVIGFAGKKIQEKLTDSVVFAVESKGSGSVIYMTDNPLFRGFWYNGLFLFGNALFQVK